MITVKEVTASGTVEWVDFDMIVSPYGTHFINELVIGETSFKVMEHLKIENGCVVMNGAKFKMEYFTESFDHSSSVLGQFVFVLRDFLKTL